MRGGRGSLFLIVRWTHKAPLDPGCLLSLIPATINPRKMVSMLVPMNTVFLTESLRKLL